MSVYPGMILNIEPLAFALEKGLEVDSPRPAPEALSSHKIKVSTPSHYSS